MNLKEYVKTYLEKNYSLILNETTFNVIDLVTKKVLTLHQLKNDLVIIFCGQKMDGGIFIDPIVDVFYQEKRSNILTSFYSSLSKLDYSKTSFALIDDVYAFLESDGYLEESGELMTPHSFLFKQFEEFYFERYIKSGKLEALKKLIDLENYFDVDYFVNIHCNLETAGVYNFIKREITKFYLTGFNTKLQTLLDRSKVKLGLDDWYVENLDYGLINSDKIIHFLADGKAMSQHYKDIIKDRFTKWVSEETIKASEEIMKTH